MQQPGQISTTVVRCTNVSPTNQNLQIPVRWNLFELPILETLSTSANSALYYHKHNSLPGTERRLCTMVKLTQYIFWLTRLKVHIRSEFRPWPHSWRATQQNPKMQWIASNYISPGYLTYVSPFSKKKMACPRYHLFWSLYWNIII